MLYKLIVAVVVLLLPGPLNAQSWGIYVIVIIYYLLCKMYTYNIIYSLFVIIYIYVCIIIYSSDLSTQAPTQE